MMAFTIYGKAEPAGSKQALVPTDKRGEPYRKDGRIVVSVVDANRKSKAWKRRVAETVRARYSLPPMDCPVRVEIMFYRQRPKGHMGKNGVRPSAPAMPHKRPDVLKLARAVEDALTGVLWTDDALIVDEHLIKRYAAPGEAERVVVRFEPC